MCHYEGPGAWPLPTRERKALLVIAEALRTPSGGSYWPARAFLDELDIYHDDLNDFSVLYAVACAALAGPPPQASAEGDGLAKASRTDAEG